MNSYFGAKLMTSSGFFLNNEMADFSLPDGTDIYGLPPNPVSVWVGGRLSVLLCVSVCMCINASGCALYKCYFSCLTFPSCYHFSVQANFPGPHKRPQSSMCPLIVKKVNRALTVVTGELLS